MINSDAIIVNCTVDNFKNDMNVDKNTFDITDAGFAKLNF